MSLAYVVRAARRDHVAPAPPSSWRATRAITRRGLGDQHRSPLIWGGTLGLLSAFVVALYPSIQDALTEAVRDYPEGLKQAFGIGELDTVAAYLHAEMLSFITPLAVAFLAARSASRPIAAAEEEGFLDVLLAAPLSRRQLVAGSFAATVAVVAAALALTAVLTWLGGLVAGAGLSASAVAAGTAAVLPLGILFGGLAVAFAGALRGSARVVGLTMGTAVAMYLVDVVGRLSDAVEPLRYLSAFRYYGRAVEDGIDPIAFAGLSIAGIALVALGTRLFERRDVLGR